jgi:hypothetical protein
MTTDDRRWKAALHESAHFTANLLGRGEVAALVSVRPGKTHGGATILDAPARVNFTGRRNNPLGADLAWRRDVEWLIVVLLAGHAAEELAGASVGRIPEPGLGDDERQAAALAQSLAELAPLHAQLLADSEARPLPSDGNPLAGDDLNAFELSFRLVGLEAQAHLGWLRAVARRFVNDHAHIIAALARELDRRTVVTGTDAAAIVHRIREEEEEPHFITA